MEGRVLIQIVEAPRSAVLLALDAARQVGVRLQLDETAAERQANTVDHQGKSLEARWIA